MVYKLGDDHKIKISIGKLERDLEFEACKPGVGLQPYGLVS
jgi:hypothetical protein